MAFGHRSRARPSATDRSSGRTQPARAGHRRPDPWVRRALGKPTPAAVLVEALAWQGSACVLLDPKPSRDLAAVVTGVGGTIWTLGGVLRWDAPPSDPSELANQLVEVLPVDARTKVYRDVARLWVQCSAVSRRYRRQGPPDCRDGPI